MRSRVKYGIGLWVAILAALPLQAQRIAYTIQSEDQIVGRDAARNVEFSSLSETQDFVVVSLVVRGSKEIRAEIDYAKREVKITARSLQTGVLASLNQSDHEVLAELAAAARWGRASRAEEALASTLNLLDSYPAGEAVNLSTARIKKLAEKAFTSLCGKTGSPMVGTYTVGSQVFTETAQLGPCFSEPNECLGHCGAGCKGAPGDAVQRFTQECFNHDLCTRKTGHRLGACTDEFAAAADGFFFAPDCGSLQGSWTDNFGYEWDLVQSSNVHGEVQTTACLVWDVTGTHKGADIKLMAKNPHDLTNCCTFFTYTGKANDCNSASGTWQNGGCTGSGTWTMVREGAGVQLLFTDNEGNLATPAERH